MPCLEPGLHRVRLEKRSANRIRPHFFLNLRELTMLDKATALRLIDGKPWHHDYEIIPGVRTGGAYDPRGLWNELGLPEDLKDVSLADIGASNGFFSFEARKRGARVVAFDRRHSDNSGFGLVQHINGITDIQHHQVNVLDLTPEAYGQFDVVLALGLLYHIADPYRALANCAGLSRNTLFIESYCIDSQLPRGQRNEPVMRFLSDPRRFPGRHHVNSDPSNFWGFTSACLAQMVEDLGFEVLRSRLNAERVLIHARRIADDPNPTRLKIAYGTIARRPGGQDRNEPLGWNIF